MGFPQSGKMASWSEVEIAQKEKRHELVLTGSAISERIDRDGLDNSIFKLKGLNFLEISRTSLSSMPDDLKNLENLTNLVLCGNKLSEISESLTCLSKLKLLDVSRNVLTVLPGLEKLTALQTLNVSGNRLSEFPDISSLAQLHVLDISHNALSALPAGISSESLSLLGQVFANGNEITEIPADLTNLQSLRTLDVSDNKLVAIPAELGDCSKMKDLKFGGNKLKDRRLGKMMDQCSTKSVLEYLRGVLQKEQKSGGGKKKDVKKKRDHKKSENVEDLSKNLMQVLHFKDPEGKVIKVEDSVLQVRPFIVCCVVRNLNFGLTKNMFKRFINLQVRLQKFACDVLCETQNNGNCY